MKQTSITHPLRIDYVNAPGTSGVIGMTLCPGKVQKSALSGDWQRDLELDLEAIQAWGGSTIVTLMKQEELDAFKVPDLHERIPDGMKHFNLPITDGGVPDNKWEKTWAEIGPKIRATLKEGSKIIVHCRGGLGRTGLVAARLLVEFGMDPDQAILAVRRARKGAIENAAQEQYVRKQKTIESMPCRPYYRISKDRASSFRGCLLGGAVGDALGAPVEFMDLATIRAKFGPAGVRNMAPAYGRAGGAVTDDTQMTLFTAEGALRAHVRGLLKGISSMPGVVAHAYQRWLFTQGIKGKAEDVGRDGWLLSNGDLFAVRAPGNTCVSALKEREVLGDSRPAQNQSKGCGGVMRVAPIGLYVASRGLPPRQAFTWGCEVAALTHGHPTGQLPAGVLAMVICELVEGCDLLRAMSNAKVVLQEHSAHEETLDAIVNGERLAVSSRSPEASLADLGQGWVAEEALSIALFCALKGENLEEGVIMAANITGDSDSTAAITGNILGAMLGVHEIPDRWLEKLELRQVITAMGDDLASVNDWMLGHDETGKGREEEYWWGRYPGW